jgi:hypothetical protein
MPLASSRETSRRSATRAFFVGFAVAAVAAVTTYTRDRSLGMSIVTFVVALAVVSMVAGLTLWAVATSRPSPPTPNGPI